MKIRREEKRLPIAEFQGARSQRKAGKVLMCHDDEDNGNGNVDDDGKDDDVSVTDMLRKKRGSNTNRARKGTQGDDA